MKGLLKEIGKIEDVNKNGLIIDVSSLAKDRRGMGFFVKEFLNRLMIVEHPFIIQLASREPLAVKSGPFPITDPKDLDDSCLTWFPFNHPTFRPPGDYAVTIHDLAPFIFPQGEAKLRKLFAKGARFAKRIFADSQFIADQIHDILKIEKSKIMVIPPGFNSQWPDEEAFRPVQPYLLGIGPAERRKNFHIFLTAFRELKKKFPHKLAIVGELPPWRRTFGPFVFETKNPLPRLVRKMGLQDEVIFPGVVSRAELKHWYQRASLVVVPSLYEGFGFPVLEAFSCNVPVVCSHAASLPEVAGEAAFYFNPYDPDDLRNVMEHVLTNPAGVEKKKLQAQIQLAKFSWKKCVEKYLTAFESLA